MVFRGVVCMGPLREYGEGKARVEQKVAGVWKIARAARVTVTVETMWICLD